MTTDTGLSYRLALGEGNEYAAAFASILNSLDAASDFDAEDDYSADDSEF